MNERMQVKEHLDNLKGVGVKLEEDDQAMFLLYSVSRSYKSFVDIITYCKDDISINGVKNVMLPKELKRLTSSSGRDSVESKLTVNKGNKMEKNHGLRCYHYKKIGHLKRTCPHRKKGKELRATTVQNKSVGV